MFGIHPILFFAQRTAMTGEERAEYEKLRINTNKTPELQDRFNQLLQKTKEKNDIEMMVPIIFDGGVIPAHVADTSLQMSKSVSLLPEGDIEVIPQLNSSTINIVSSSSGFSQLVMDAVFMLADISFTRQIDKAPTCAFFGGNLAISSGFITGISYGYVAGTSKQMISINIARRPDSLIFGELIEIPDAEDVVNALYDI